MTDIYTLTAIAVISGVTILLRALPFVIFNEKRKTPKIIEKLSRILPSAVIGMLVVYCFKDISFTDVSTCLPSVIAGAVVGVLYIWKRNTLISILCGTVCYMALVQFVF